MRVKVSLQNPETNKKETHLLSVPKHLKYIIDLQAHIIDRLSLSTFLENNQHTISLFIDDCHLPKNEKIADLIKDEDIINIDLAPVKRQNPVSIDNLFSLGSENINNEAILDHHFVRLMQEVSLLRNLYSRAKIRKLDEGQEKRIVIEEPVGQPVKTIYKEKLIPQEKIQQKSQEPKKKIAQKKVIVESSSESESDPEVIVKKKTVQQAKPAATKQQLRGKKIVQEESSEERSSEEEVTPKAKSNKPVAPKMQEQAKHVAKPAPKKVTKTITMMAMEEESEGEEEKPVPIKEKKITTNLNIPTPAEAFNKKKEEWEKMPVSQWNAAKKSKDNKKSQQNQPSQVIQSEIKTVQIHPPKNAAAKAQNQNQAQTQPASSTQQKQQENQQQQQKPQKKNEAPKTSAYDEFVNKSKLLKESLGQTAPPAQHNKPAVPAFQQEKKPFVAPVTFPASTQKNNGIVPYDYEGQDEPFFKRPIYEPNLLTADLEEAKKAKEGGNFPGFVEIPVEKLNQKWAQDNALLLKQGDIIKYKCETLSVSGPVVSAWREGGIIKIQKNQIEIKRSDFIPSNVQEGDDDDDDVEGETEEDQLFVHNLRGVYVKKTCLNEEREKFIKDLAQGQNKKPDVLIDELAEKKRKLQEELQKKIEQSEEEAMKDVLDYKRSRIGKQINYYFSEKNYEKDKFIKAHVEKDPERYMPISLLLNFPKIRGMSTDPGMILESIKYILRTDPNCNYEIDETESRIKKKIL